MFAHFTDDARTVVVLAREESAMCGHSSIDVPHLVLALLRTPAGEAFGVSYDAALASLTSVYPPDGSRPSGHVPFSQGLKDVLANTSGERTDASSLVLSVYETSSTDLLMTLGVKAL